MTLGEVLSLGPTFYKKSPTRRTKSKWEPLEEKSVDKLGSLNNYV
ncbi:hypothetical protein Goari_006950, partial [Gossypium aridum]|nr:hypothetical protein [Gossypium aridum]